MFHHNDTVFDCVAKAVIMLNFSHPLRLAGSLGVLFGIELFYRFETGSHVAQAGLELSR